MKGKSDSIKKAVALNYKDEDNAPRIVGKGKGEIADKLLDIGKEENITIYKDEELVEDLYKLDINEEISPELYEAVAKIIAYVYSLDERKGETDE